MTTRFPNGITAAITTPDHTDYSDVLGCTAPINFGTGTWTTTRIAEANYVKRHTATSETSIIAVDVTKSVRTAAKKGYKLNSISYTFSVGTAAITTHTCTLDQVTYANNVAVAVTSVPVTGTLHTATQTNPYTDTITVTTPAFLNTANSHYVLEITVVNATTTAYDYYGICLNYTRNDSD